MKPIVGFLRLEFEDKNSSAPIVPPTEFLIFPKGRHTSEKGDFVFDEESAKSVIEGYKRRGHDVQIDYEHDSLLPASEKPTDGPVPAAGWFKPEVRNGELWATEVKWTPRMLSMLKDREYRFYSPAFLYDKASKRITELLSVGVTNDPAQHNQTPLIAAKNDEPKEPQPMKTLLAALKLSENAAEAEALAALEKLRKSHQLASTQRSEVMELTGTKTFSEAIGTIRAWKAGAKNGGSVKEELAKLKKAQRATRVEKLVAKGMKEGKLTPAQKKEFTELAMQKNGIRMLKSYLAAATPVVDRTKHKEKPRGDKGKGGTDVATLTDDEKKVCAALGVSQEDFLKRKANGMVDFATRYS